MVLDEIQLETAEPITLQEKLANRRGEPKDLSSDARAKTASYWSLAPRRFVLAGAFFILGTIYGAFEYHWILPVLSVMFLIGILPLLGIRPRSAVLLSLIILIGYGNSHLRGEIHGGRTLTGEQKSISSRRTRYDRLNHDMSSKAGKVLVLPRWYKTRHAQTNAKVSPLPQPQAKEQDWGASERNRIGGFMQQQLGKQNGSLLASMVLGNRAVKVEAATKKAFRKSGLSHVLAASGFNLSVLVASVYVLCRILFIGAHIRLPIGMAVMVVFIIIAGPSPSVERAFFMGTVILLGDTVNRTPHLAATLMFSAIAMLAFNPNEVADIGLQLSYFSTAGLVLCAKRLQCAAKRALQAIPTFIVSILTASCVAQAFVFPLQVFYFQQLNPYFLLANGLAAPLLPAISIAGFATTSTFLVESSTGSTAVSSVLAQLCYWPVELFRQLVQMISRFPFAQIETNQPSLLIVCLYFLSLFAALHFSENRFGVWFRGIFLAAMSLLVISLFF